MIPIAWQLARRHWITFLVLTFWYGMPWLTAALGFDLSYALRFSWMVSAPFAVYMYQVTSGSQLLGILPLARREVWQITCVMGALVPAVIQFVVATIILILASLLLPADTTVNPAGMDSLVLGALYSLAFLQLVLIATASVRRQALATAAIAVAAIGALLWRTQFLPSDASEFTTLSTLVVWVGAVVGIVIVRVPGSLAAPVPARPATYRLTLGLPAIGMLDRLTGVKRILIVQVLLGVACFAAAFSLGLMMSVWVDDSTLVGVAADELRAFRGGGEWLLRSGESLFFMPMWVIGLANIWTPMARQLRVLPLTPREVNAVFLAWPIVMWLVLWMMYLAAYAIIVGGPMTPRVDLFLAISGTSTLASVISLRWKNRLYGMVGVAFVYSFWTMASIVALVVNPADATIPLLIIGAVFYAAAVTMNHKTLLHATSASPAYQRQPKFFDTPARS
jgi:hypothetical protein